EEEEVDGEEEEEVDGEEEEEVDGEEEEEVDGEEEVVGKLATEELLNIDAVSDGQDGDLGELLEQQKPSGIISPSRGRVEVTYISKKPYTPKRKTKSQSRIDREEQRRAKRVLKEEIQRREQEKNRRRAKEKEERARRRERESRYRPRKRESRHSNEKRKVREHHSSRKKEKSKGRRSMRYYKDFRKKPADFRKLHSSSPMEYSSTESESSSSDDFPSPSTPRSNRDQEKIFRKIRDLQRRLYKSEIENRKLRERHRRKHN
ncbi:MAG TPA: hypothetical protein QGF58_09295, partial [Myxococcota bacterium]|nr:hypothetical protein [Myxococcota bacterium]